MFMAGIFYVKPINFLFHVRKQPWLFDRYFVENSFYGNFVLYTCIFKLKILRHTRQPLYYSYTRASLLLSLFLNGLGCSKMRTISVFLEWVQKAILRKKCSEFMKIRSYCPKVGFSVTLHRIKNLKSLATIKILEPKINGLLRCIIFL